MTTATLPRPKAKAKPQMSAFGDLVLGNQFTLAPMDGERQDSFFERAMRALKNSVPSVNRRTVEVLRIWKSSQNDQDLRDKASLQFPEDKFARLGPRCVFVEHSIPASADGQREAITYNRANLLRLVNWANYRIRNSDNFAAISDGHTPTQEELAAGRPMPDVLGYAGPFYLGLLGDVDPKWAIYCDEHVHLTDLPRYEKLQRRSPEVWCKEPIERRTMDPIAALGAETPRLDSGMNPYSRAGDGREVIRYSAFAFPGSHNSFVPGDGSRTHKYAGDQPMPLPNPAATPGLPPAGPQAAGADQGQQLADAITQALQNLMPSIIQSVQEAMGSDGSGVPPEADPGLDPSGMQAGGDPSGDVPRGMDDPSEMAPDMGGDMSGADAGMDPNAMPADPGMNGGDPAATPAPPAASTPDPSASSAPSADGMDDAEKRQYAAMSPDCQSAYMAGRRKGSSMTQRYSRNSNDDLHATVARQAAQINALTKKVDQERSDAVRYSKLNELGRTYAFDIQEEFETCADMTDSQFERHVTATVTKYSRRDDETAVELYDDNSVEVERYGRGGQPSRQQVAQLERYSREAAQMAARKNALKRGSTTYDAEFQALCTQHGLVV